MSSTSVNDRPDVPVEAIKGRCHNQYVIRIDECYKEKSAQADGIITTTQVINDRVQDEGQGKVEDDRRYWRS
eukprot:3124153-Amphidinium_carterae.1